MEMNELFQSENFLESLNEDIIIEIGQIARAFNEELRAGKHGGCCCYSRTRLIRTFIQNGLSGFCVPLLHYTYEYKKKNF